MAKLKDQIADARGETVVQDRAPEQAPAASAASPASPVPDHVWQAERQILLAEIDRLKGEAARTPPESVNLTPPTYGPRTTAPMRGAPEPAQEPTELLAICRVTNPRTGRPAQTADAVMLAKHLDTEEARRTELARVGRPAPHEYSLLGCSMPWADYVAFIRECIAELKQQPTANDGLFLIHLPGHKSLARHPGTEVSHRLDKLPVWARDRSEARYLFDEFSGVVNTLQVHQYEQAAAVA